MLGTSALRATAIFRAGRRQLRDCALFPRAGVAHDSGRVAYAIWSGDGIASIALIGWAVYLQALDAGAIVTIALIIAGVVVIELFPRGAAHRAASAVTLQRDFLGATIRRKV